MASYVGDSYNALSIMLRELDVMEDHEVSEVILTESILRGNVT